MRAFLSVLTAGENNAACMNATMSFVLAEKFTLLAEAEVCLGSVVSGVIHSLVCTSRYPCKRILPSLDMRTWFASNNAVQPASHSWPTDSREKCFMVGKMYALVAVLGKCWSDSCVVSVECICWPFGNPTAMGCDVEVR